MKVYPKCVAPALLCILVGLAAPGAAQTLRESFIKSSIAPVPVAWDKSVTMRLLPDQQFDSPSAHATPDVATLLGEPEESRFSTVPCEDLKLMLDNSFMPGLPPSAAALTISAQRARASTEGSLKKWLLLHAHKYNPATYALQAYQSTVLASCYRSTLLLSNSSRAALLNSNRNQVDIPSLVATDYYMSLPTGAGTKTLWFEVENEPARERFKGGRKDQKNVLEQHTPAMVAAQISMLYDGHGKSNAAIWPLHDSGEDSLTLGLKHVSRQNKVAVAGLAGLQGSFVEGMIDWFAANRQLDIYGFLDGDINRDGSSNVLAFDALSFHHYTASNNLTPFQEYTDLGLRQWNSELPGIQGESPETHGLRERLEYLITTLYTEIRTKHSTVYPEMEGKEIWLSEFGYDSDNLAVGDPFVADDGNTYTATGGIQIPDLVNVNDPDGDPLNKERVHGQWLSRSYLELMAVNATIPSLGGKTEKGVDRFMQYEMADPSIKPLNAPGRQQFQSSGLLEQTGEPKVAHYYTRTLLHHLGNYKMNRTKIIDLNFLAPNYQDFPASHGVHVSIPSPQAVAIPNAVEDHPVVYEFDLGTATTSTSTWFAVWSPTEGGYDYEVEIDVASLFSDVPSEVTVIRLRDLAERGLVESYPVTGGKVFLNVTEEPFLLRAGSPGVNTNVAPPRALFPENLCCGDARLHITRNRRPRTSSFEVGYALQSAAAGGFIPLSEVTIVASGFVGRQVTIPSLEIGQAYYLIAIPTNAAGFGYDLSQGIPVGAGFDAAYPALSITIPFFPSSCSDGASGCNYPVAASEISFPVPDPINTNTTDLSAILSGGVATLEDFCSPDLGDYEGPFWGYNSDLPTKPSVAVVTFSTPIDIDRVAIWDHGAEPRVVTPGVIIEYATCDCPDIWRQYIVHDHQGIGKRSAYAQQARRVAKLRITKRGMNLAGISMCAQQTTCFTRNFTEEPIVNVDEVGPDFGKVSWVGAFDTASQTSAAKYVIELAENLDQAGYLSNASQVFVEAAHGNSLTYQLEQLTPGTTYYGRLAPEDDCLKAIDVPVVLSPRPYSATDSSFFTFTVPGETNHGRAGTPTRGEPTAVAEFAPATDVRPNPTSGKVELSSGVDMEEIIVRDGAGRQVMHFTPDNTRTTTLDLSDLAAGLYHISIIAAGEVETHLVTKQ